MSIILLLLSVSIFIAACFLAAFLWSVRSGQYEDDYSPAHRILFDDQPGPPDPPISERSNKNKP